MINSSFSGYDKSSHTDRCSGDFVADPVPDNVSVYQRESNKNNNRKPSKSTGRDLRMPGTVVFGVPSTKAICVNFVTVVVSTIGLIVLVLGYCCLGGAVFEWLESNSENETIVNDRRHVAALVKQHAANLYAQLQLDATNQSIDTVTTISLILNNVSYDAFIIGDEGNWDGEPEGEPVSLDWTLSGAILFSVTTITTIGKVNL